MSYDGPFRVHLIELRLHSDLDVSRRGEDQAPPRRVLTATVQVFAEPGLRLGRDGPARIEATDDQGRPLPPPSPNAERPSRAMLQYEVPLGPLAGASSRLRELRGTVPLAVSRSRPDPLKIALSDAAGKTYLRERVSLRFETLEVSGPPRLTQFFFFLGSEAGSEVPPELYDRLDVVDAEGRPLRWMVHVVGRMPNGEVKMRASVSSRFRPAELRLYDVIATRREVSFVFRDVPLP